MLGIIQSTGHTQVLGTDPSILKELTGIIARLFFITFEKSRQSEKIPDDCKEADSTSIIKKSKKVKKKDPDNYRIASFTSVSVKVIKQNILKAISKHMKDRLMESRVYQGQLMPDFSAF